MPFIRYTAKKILMITALSNTLAPMVKTYIRAGVIIESVIDCVRWASLACPGAFYIYEIFLKKFLPEPNIGHYPFGTMDEREIEISSMCWWKGKEVNSYGEIFFQRVCVPMLVSTHVESAVKLVRENQRIETRVK